MVSRFTISRMKPRGALCATISGTAVFKMSAIGTAAAYVQVEIGELGHHHVIDDLSRDLRHEFAPLGALDPIVQRFTKEIRRAVAEFLGR